MTESSSQSSSQSDTVIISVNPKAGRTSPMLRAEELQCCLEKKGFRVELLTDLDLVGERANFLFADGRLRVLLGVGGDGTAAELVNRTAIGTPVSLLPAGTANLLAKHFQLPFQPKKAAEMIESGATLTLDAGRANNRLFLVMVSAGIDADIVSKVHQRREANYQKQAKKGAHISYLSYIKPIFSSILSYSYPLINVRLGFSVDMNSRLDSKEKVTDVATTFESNEEQEINRNEMQSFPGEFQKEWGKWTFVFNLPRYGWGVTLVPHCLGNDAQLDYCFFRRAGLIASLWNVGMAQFGGLHRFLPNTRLGKATVLQWSSESAIPFQLDGDPGGFLPVQIEVVPQRFTLVAPFKVVQKFHKSSIHSAK
ncbi:MAG: diacylglycerol kinase family protein [Planctomycetia bacterium]|nr:diacylglycerol kinase family protein [Planctomycetia bacterium]